MQASNIHQDAYENFRSMMLAATDPKRKKVYREKMEHHEREWRRQEQNQKAQQNASG